MAKTNIYRVAVVDKNFNIMYYLPDFYSTKDGAKEAIERVINNVHLAGWVKKDWDRHRWQSCEDQQTGTRSIEMVKTAEYKDWRGTCLFRGYGFITYTLI